jgi:hypothetical protein
MRNALTTKELDVSRNTLDEHSFLPDKAHLCT